LIEADDGHFYVVKFKNNPQHRRILVNELVAGVFLRYLKLAAPETRLVRVTPEFLEEYPGVHMKLGTRRLDVEPGWHFGSRFPGDPDTMAVYDFIPDALLSTVANRSHFLGILVFDKWVGNADSRQSIFFRARLKEWLPETRERRRLGFVAQMMDHGYIFNGPHWEFADSPIQGLYYRPSVYRDVQSLEAFEPWLDQVTHFPDEILDEAYKQIPKEWLEGDEENLERLLHRLQRRRSKVADLIRDCRQGRVNPFSNWS
jgi:hypothetical protein